jgi:autotransporter-associated beta strand protein
VNGFANSASINAQISGTSGLTKSGNGVLVLGNTSNNYTGNTMVTGGALVVNNSNQLGSGNLVSVSGFNSAGFAGGLLVFQGGSGSTFSKNLSLAGRGQNFSNSSAAAFQSIGLANTLSGSVTFANNTGAALYNNYGNLTISGNVLVPAGNSAILGGSGNIFISGLVTGGVVSTDRFVKTNGSLASTLWLQNTNNNYVTDTRIDSGNVRVSSSAVLGQLSTSTTAIDLNNGVLEVVTDAPDFSGRTIRVRDNTTDGVYVSRAIGGSGLNQTVAFGRGTQNTNTTLNVTGRDGYNVSIGDGVNTYANPGAGSATVNSSGNGLVTINAPILFTSGDGTTRTLTLGGNSDFLTTGNVNRTGGGVHALVKSGTGNLTFQGTASTMTGGTSVNGGTLIINSIGNVSGGGLNGSTGGVLNLNAGALDYRGTAVTGAAETTAKVINLSGTTAAGIILANTQGGSAPTALTLAGNISAGGAGAKVLTLGGASTLDNTISGVIQNNTPQSLTSIVKSGSGTWLYSPATTSYANPTLAVPTSLATTGGTASQAVVNMANTTGLAIGQTVFGANIPAGAYITAIAPNVSITLNTNIGTTAVGAITLGFAGLNSTTNTTAGSAANTNTLTVASTTGLVPGMFVNGANVPAGSVITRIIDATTFTISSNISTAVTTANPLYFSSVGNFGQLSGATAAASVTIGSGTLKVRPTATTGNGANLFTNAQNLVFNQDPTTLNQSAGGTFQLVTPVPALTATLTQTMGALTPTLGLGRVQVDAGVSGSILNQLSFTSLGARAAGAGLNFVSAANAGTQFVTPPTGLGGQIGGFAYFTNTAGNIDFVGTPAANTNVAALGAATVLPASGAAVGTNYVVNTAVNQTAAQSANTVRIVGGNNLTLTTGALTIASTNVTTLGGILHDNSTGASSITGQSLFVSTAAQELVITTGGTAAANTNPLTISSAITGNNTATAGGGSVTKNGTGTLVLSGTNTFTGTLTINEGRVNVGSNAGLGGTNAGLAIRQGATLDLAGFNIGTVAANGLNAFNGAGTITNTGATQSILRVGNNNTGGLFSGSINDNAGATLGGAGTIAFSKAGSGAVTLSGASTFTGGLTINGGQINATSINTVTGSGASSIGRGNGTSAATNAASLVFNGGILNYTGSSAAIYQTTQTPSISTDRLFTLAGNGTILSNGQYGNSILATGAQNNAALVFNNTSDIVFSGAGTRLLTLGGNSTGDNSMAIRLIDNGASALSLTKQDAGLWILNPSSASSYTGQTQINRGALQAVLGTGISSSSAISFTDNTGGVFQSGNTTAASVTPTFGTAAGNIGWTAVGSGGFAAGSAPFTVNVTGTPTWGSTANFLGTGNLILNSTTALSDITLAGDFNIAAGVAVPTASLTTTAGSATVNLASGTTAGLTVGQVVGPNASFPTAVTITAINTTTQFTVSSGTGILAGTAVSTNIAAGGFRQIQVDDNGNTTTDFATISSNIGGTGALAKIGTGTLNLLGANTYSGDTFINNGTTIVNSIGASGATATSFGTNVSGGALNLGLATTTGTIMYVGSGETVTRAIKLSGSTGGGSIESSGSGPLILAGNIDAGTVTGNKTLTLRGINVGANEVTGILANNGANALSVTKNDSGTWILSGANTFTGNLTLSGGLLGVTDANAAAGALGAVGSGNVIFGNGAIYGIGGALTIGRNVQIASSSVAAFTGVNAITVTNAVTGNTGNNWTINNSIASPNLLTFSGAFNSAEAATQARTLTFNGTGNTVFNGALQGTGATNGAVSLLINTAGNATTTFNAAGQLSGTGTEIRAGILVLGAANALGTAAGTTLNFSGGELRSTVAGTNTIPNNIVLNNMPTVFGGSGAITLGGSFAGSSGGDRQLINNISGGSVLTFGATGISVDTTARTFILAGTGTSNFPSPIANATVVSAAAGNLNYIGSGAVNLTAANTYTGTTTLSGGTTTLSGSGSLVAVTAGSANLVTLNRTANLVLNNTGTAANNRLGTRQLTINSANFSLIGHASTAVTESLGALTPQVGGNVINLTNNGGSNTLTFASLGTFGVGASINFTGGVGSATNKVVFTTAPTLTGGTTPTVQGLLAKTTVGGTAFGTYNTNGTATNTNGLQAFTGYTTPANVSAISPLQTLQVNGSTVGLNFGGGGGTTNALAFTGGSPTLTTSYASTLNVTSGGILATGGTYGLGAVTNFAGVEGAVHVNTGSTLNLSGAFIGTAGFSKNLGGALNISSAQYNNGQTTLNAGSTTLSGGSNTLFPGSALIINQAATLDLNGNNQFVGTFNGGINIGTGGTVTSSSAALFSANGNGTFAGQITGSISFNKYAGNTLTVSSPLAYTGATTVGAGGLTLRDDATLLSTSAIVLNSGTLTLDNNANNFTTNLDRVGDSIPLTLSSGQIVFQGRFNTPASETLGALTLINGANIVQSLFNQTNTNFNQFQTSSDLTLASLSRTAGATINLVGTNTALGLSGSGATGGSASRIFFTTAPSTLANGMLGAWAIANTTDFASYDPALGVGAFGYGGFASYSPTLASGNVTQILSNASAVTTTLPSGTTITGALRLGGVSLTDIAFTNGSDILNLETGGLLRSNQNAGSTIGTPALRGVLTAGGASPTGTQELVIYSGNNTTTNVTGAAAAATTLGSATINLLSTAGMAPGQAITGPNIPVGSYVTAVNSGTQVTISQAATNNSTGGTFVPVTSTVTVNSVIADNGATPIALVKSGSGPLNLSANNTYTGGTTINQGTVNLIGSGAVLPNGGVTLTNATLNMLGAAGQINSANNVILNDSSTLNLYGNNSLSSLTFNNNGGSTTPTVNTDGTGTGTAGTLTLTNTNAITVTSSNANSINNTPTINGLLDLGATDKTMNVGAIQLNGQLISALTPSLTIPAIVSGSGLVTKSGAGLLQLSGQNTFSGGLAVTGGGIVIGANSTPSTFSGVSGSGTTVTSGPLGTGAVTFSDGATIASTGAFSVSNNVTFLDSSGTLSGTGTTTFAGLNNINFNGVTTLPATWNAIVQAPQTTITIADAFNSLSTDVINVTGRGQLVIGFFGGTLNLPIPTISLVADGNSRGTLETISLGGGVVLSGADTNINVKPQASPNAFNKTLTKTTLTTAGAVYAVIPSNGYGLDFTGDTTLTVGNPTFSVLGSTASNVIQGLTLSGVVDDGADNYGLVKSGTGTLVLNGANTFGGSGQTITVQGGVLSINSNASLGNSANQLVLAVDSTTGTGLRATSTFTATGRNIALNAANNAIEVTAGNVLTLDTAPTLGSNSNNLIKNDNGVLELTTTIPSWSGTVTVAGGAIRATGVNPFGSSALTTSGAGSASYQLSNSTINNAMTLSVVNGATGLNSTGVIFGFSGTSTYSGLITQASGVAANYGAASGATLNLTGGIASANSATFNTVGTGIVNLQSVLGTGDGGGNLNKIGTGTLNITTSQANKMPINVNQGTLVVSGSGVSLGTTGLITVGTTGTLTVSDATGSPTAHLGGRALTVQGTFNYAGNAGTSAETAGALTMDRGGSIFNITTGGGTNALTFASLANAADQSGNFTGSGLGTASNRILFTTAPTLVGGATAATNGILARYTLNGSTFATYNTNGTATNTNGIQAFTGYNATAGSAANINTAGATDTTDITAAMTTRAFTATKTLNALRFSDASGATISGAAFNQLTLTAGAILATGGGTNLLTVPVLANAAVQNINHVDASTTLNISSAIIGTGGLVKDGAGTLILSAPAANAGGLAASANTLTGTVNVSRGTLQLAGGKNTLNTNLAVVIGGPGSTLDLNGTSQYVASLLTDSGTPNAAGTVTSGVAGGHLVINQSNNGRNFAGSLTGSLSLTRSGQNTLSMFSPNTYTGNTLINGGVVSLQSDATLASTSNIDINYATLNADNNTGLTDNSNRINDSAAITLRGGTLTLTGRAQTASSETIGSVSVAQGFSVINATVGGTGINSAELALSSLSRPVGSSAIFFANGTNLGQVGSNSRITVGTLNGVATAPITYSANGSGLTNNIVGGWAITNNEFLTYIPGLGLAPLNQTGAAQYDLSNTFVGSTATSNVRLTATTNIALGGSIANAVSMTGSAINLNFAAATDTLNIVSGGLIGPNNNQSIGSVVDSGRLTAGGLTPAANTDLYIYNRANTLTINSRIIDNTNGSTSSVRAVFSASGGTISLVNPNASYTGGTVLNAGTLTLNNTAATAVIPAGGLEVNNATLTMNNFAGQIAAANVVTLNGGSTVNLYGNNTLAGVVFNNTGGTGNPTLNSFVAPTATVTAGSSGVLTIGASGVVVTSSNVGTVAILEGRADFGSSLNTVDVDSINANGFTDVAPLVGALRLRGIVGSTGGFNKTGAGVAQYDGITQYTGPTNVNNGGLRIGAANAGSRFSTYALGSGTTLNLAGNGTTLGALSGSGSVINSGAAATLSVGFNNASTTFSGQLNRFNDAVINGVALTKVGTGTLTMASAQNFATGSIGTITVNGGSLRYADAGKAFVGTTASGGARFTINNGGTLSLDNTGVSSFNNRLGLNTVGTLDIQGGTLAINAGSTAATPVTELVTTFNVTNGGGRIELTPDASNPVTLTLSTLNTANGTGSLVIGGITGAASANGVANVIISTANLLGTQGGAANGATTLSVRHDILADASATGLGTGFLVKDSVTNNWRALGTASTGSAAPGELSSTFALPLTTDVDLATAGNQAAGTLNVGLAGGTTVLSVSSVANTLTLTSGTSVINGLGTTFGNYGPGGALLGLTLSNAAASLTLAGATGNINTGNFGSTTAGNTIYSHVITGGTLNLNGFVGVGNTGGFLKADGGSLNFNAPSYYTGATVVNNGTLNLNSGAANTLTVVPGATTPTIGALTLNGTNTTVNLNGQNQAVNALSSVNALPGYSGSVTSSAAATLTSIGGGNFAGNIGGALSFTRAGNNTTLLTSSNSYSGATIVRGGTLQLRDSGTALNSSSFNLQYGTLNIDQSGVNPDGSVNPARISNSAPITLQGGTLTLTPGGSADFTASVGTVSLTGGATTIRPIISQSQGGLTTLTIANLQTTALIAANGTVNFDGVNAQLGQAGIHQGQVFLTQANGVVIPNNTTFGPNIIFNSGDYGQYVTTQGAGPLGTTGYSAYGAALTSGANSPTVISATSGNLAIAANTTVGSLKYGTNATNAITFTLGTEVLNLALGGLLSSNNNNAVNIGTSALRGIVTTGGIASSGTFPLWAYQAQNTTTIESVIANNGSGAVTSLVKSGAGTLTLTAANTYTGGTTVNQGTLNLTATAASTVVIPAGGLTINNATVTQNTNNQQIASSTDVILNGNSNFNLTVGANTLNSLTWNNSGGTGNPTVNGGTGLLTLSGATAITAVNDSLATTPVLSGAGGIAFTSAPTITTSGLSTNSLNISGVISAAGGVVTKAGNGSLTLSGANTFNTGFNLDAGSLIFGVASVGTVPTITSGPVGTGALSIAGGTSILSDGTARNIGNAVTVNGDFTFGGVTAGNNVTLSGAVTLGSAGRTITVTSPAVTATLSGAITSGATLTAFTKAGAGTLIITQNALTNFGGAGVAVTGGMLKGTGAANAIPTSSALSVSAGAGYDLNSQDQTLDGLSGAGFITNSANNTRTLTISSTVTNSTFDGVFTDNILGQANSRLVVTKAGAGTTLTLTNANTHNGATNVTAGILSISNALALGTTLSGTVVSSGGSLELQNNITVTGEALSITGTGSATNGALRNLSGNNTFTGLVTLTGAASIQSDAGLLTLDVATGNAITATNQNVTFAGAGNTAVADAIATGTGTLTKTGSGSLILSGANTYSGSTSISASGGTLQLGAGGTTGTLNTSSAISVGSGATFAVNRSNAVVQGTAFSSAAITGAGGFTQAGSGTTTLNAQNTYTGTTSINAGVLNLGSAENVGTSGPLGNSAASNAGSIVFGGGTLQYSASNQNDYSGRFSTAANQAISIDTNSQNVSLATALTSSGGSLNKQGAGTLTVTGTNTFDAGTTVNGGTLLVNNTTGSGTGSGAVSVSNAGTVIGGNGTVAGNLTVNAGALIAPGSAANTAGTLTIGGSTVVIAGNGVAETRVNFDYTNATGNVAGLTPATWSSYNGSLLTGNGGQSNDLLNFTASTTSLSWGTGGKISLNQIGSAYSWVQGDVFNLLDWTALGDSGNGPGSIGGTFNSASDFNLPLLNGGLAWDTSRFVTTGAIAVVPEPSRALLMLFGLMALFFRRRRQD